MTRRSTRWRESPYSWRLTGTAHSYQVLCFPPATLRLRYNDADVARFDEAELRVLTVHNGKWVYAAESCSPPSQYVRRLAQNEMEVQICPSQPVQPCGAMEAAVLAWTKQALKSRVDLSRHR